MIHTAYMQQNKDMLAMNGKNKNGSETDFSQFKKYKDFEDMHKADDFVLKLNRHGIVGVSIPEGDKVRVYYELGAI